MFCQNQFYRLLLCLLLVGTTAWTTPPVATRVVNVRNSHNGAGSTSRCDVVVGRPIMPPPRTTAMSSIHLQARLWNRNKNRSDDHDDNHESTTPRKARRVAFRRRLRRRIARAVSILALAFTVMFSRTVARPSFGADLPLPDADTKVYSIRPGYSRADAEKAIRGMKPEEKKGGLEGKVEGGTAAKENKKSKQKVKKQKAMSATTKDFDYGYDDEWDNKDEQEFEAGAERETKPLVAADTLRTEQSIRGFATKKSPDKWLKLKVFLAFFIPVFAWQPFRGAHMLHREWTFAKKAIKIMDAQKAEYFNITKSETDDSEIQDELQGLKKNATSTDNDEEDDEDEDDDEEEEDQPPPKKKPPRGPVGGGGGGDDGSSSGGGDDSDRPSEEDLDRLNKMFDKS